MSNTLTEIPGFSDPVHDAQQAFRALLCADAQPGRSEKIPVQLQVPQGLTPACGAACLVLLDLDIKLWIQPLFSSSVKNWLLFHTGCQLTLDPQQADFALIQDLVSMTELSVFNPGTAEKPEDSTTLLIQVASFNGGKPITLTGPGNLSPKTIAPSIPSTFWEFWEQNYPLYPRGIDVFLFTEDSVMGLPRTAKHS
ncbi:phosphonate C-P lyase system protein PhnH [Cylindrospermopsis raciborskii]|uniref:Phosphonate C-P lyase system protein PhnH n=1 Tax=Cylindrospermopsis raciborskii CENA302 TaxID=1170768 RepID=A0A9Q5QUV4_9CYAN|nr:phosphonate C-P lyase system protein PhnH [Cylindrospermopsis raciborskii]MCZ2201025.1 phosphonate C-P lyase system protein PhnH [Cylindrospermopsis raciborskii PAMP2012]MCZ2206129.1 phosphonate C-P lyase system protein PhnH [Cylindrospermopsis raciborskii PAMP2011]NLQ06054.1 phosphonate C-P lyase system protein PhnH [Cylindrospermopsis raciborskii MVCC19]OHY32367.1 phosphonate C-P lyase system protein PhnH [Cylindrospermopsis raciborskii MVCC14]OPH08717.1 phosphonate C-P lyase system prote